MFDRHSAGDGHRARLHSPPMAFPTAGDLDVLRRVRAIRGTDEAVQDLPPAADELLASAGVLLLAGRHWHAVYLAGYAVECDLKYAALRTVGVPVTARAVAALPAQVNFVTRRRRGVRVESRHNLRLWATAIHLRRAEQGRPLNAVEQDRLLGAARFIDRVRWVGMRYRPLQATVPGAVGVADRVYNVARRVHRRRDTLWR